MSDKDEIKGIKYLIQDFEPTGNQNVKNINNDQKV